jgi:glycosyltransferase involved in cell wall biosynthesis
MQSIERSTFAIVSNGYADGAAQALRDFLVSRRVPRLTTIRHPLIAEDTPEHEVREWRRGELVRERRVRLPSRPPLTYPLDLLVPVWPTVVDGWVGFNALACGRGIAARAVGRVGKVAYWCVDYVDSRFGRGPLTNVFEAVDGWCCRRADARFEVSQDALDARSARHRRNAWRLAPARVVPMGAWLDRMPTTSDGAYARRRVVYLGHLVPRQGVALLIDAISILQRRGAGVSADIVGHGSQEQELHRRVREHGLVDVVNFHGFVEDHREIERILAGGSVAVAPYDTNAESFTRFADPGKLKIYMAVGLPMILTNVPPNAHVIADAGAGELIDFSAEALAAAIEDAVSSPERWRRRRQASLSLAQRYDWPVILTSALEALGFTI